MKNHFLAVGLIIVLTFLIYANSFKNEFVYDDHILIVENEFIKDWGNLPKVFTKDYFILAQKQSYRPVCTLSYFINYSFWKLNVFGWHLSKISLHIANAILIYWIVFLLLKSDYSDERHDYSDINSQFTIRNSQWKLPITNYFTPYTFSLITALLFALHPIQSETVNCISFQEDPISFFFFLTAFYFYIKFSTVSTIKRSRKQIILYFISCGSFVLALFSKETAITLLLVLILHDWCFTRIRWGKYFPYFLIAGIYLLIRFVLLRPVGYIQGVNIPSEPVYPGGTFFTRMFTMSGVFFYYVKLVFFPFQLTIHYVFPLAKSIFEPNILAGLGLLGLIFIFGYKFKKTYPAISFSLFYFFLVLLPVSNIIPFGAILQERYLYFSVFGFSLFLALLLAKALKSAKSPNKSSSFLRFRGYFCVLALISVLVFYSLRTIGRNYEWKNDILLWSKVLTMYPESAKADFALGDAYFKKGELDKALYHYQRVLEKSGKKNETSGLHRSIVYNDLGLVYLEKKDFDSAIEQFKNGLEINPRSPLIHNNLGIAYLNKNEYNLAITEFKKAIEIVPKSEEAYFNLVKVYLAQGKYMEASEILERIGKVNPQSPRLKRIHSQHQQKR